MKIDFTANYMLTLVEETPGIRADHNTVDRSPLLFSGKDLYEAIIYMGMLPSDIKKHSMRTGEITFKKSMVEAVLTIQKDTGTNLLMMNGDTLSFLDPSEMTCISYWLGMLFATLLARKKYNYEYVIHYSRFVKSDYCKSKIVPKIGSGSTPTHGTTKSSPDLITINKKMDEYGVFEAKGYHRFHKSTMEHAYDQVKNIGIVNGKNVHNNIVSFSRLSTSGNGIRFKDPSGEEELTFDQYMAILWQYMPVIELVEELGHESGANGEYLYSNKMADSIRIRVNKCIYEVYMTLKEKMAQEAVDEIDISSVREIIGLEDKWIEIILP